MKSAAYDFRRVTPAPPQRITPRYLAKERTRARVLAAARSIFAERGFEAATVRDIAQTAELSTGAVFASFVDKAELFDAVMVSAYNNCAQGLSDVLEASKGGVVQTLEEMFKAAYAGHLTQLPLVQAALSHVWGRGQAAALFKSAAAVRSQQTLTEALRRGVERGELRADADLELLSEMLWDAYVANYRLAVFENFGVEDLLGRMRQQIGALLCGFLRD